MTTLSHTTPSRRHSVLRRTTLADLALTTILNNAMRLRNLRGLRCVSTTFETDSSNIFRNCMEHAPHIFGRHDPKLGRLYWLHLALAERVDHIPGIFLSSCDPSNHNHNPNKYPDCQELDVRRSNLSRLRELLRNGPHLPTASHLPTQMGYPAFPLRPQCLLVFRQHKLMPRPVAASTHVGLPCSLLRVFAYLTLQPTSRFGRLCYIIGTH